MWIIQGHNIYSMVNSQGRALYQQASNDNTYKGDGEEERDSTSFANLSSSSDTPSSSNITPIRSR